MPTPKPTLPPLDVVVTSVTHNSVDLAWSSVTSSDVSDIMYVVEFRKRNGKQPWNTAVSSLKEDKLTVKNLESETWYLFNVRAVGPDDSTLTKPLKPLSHRTKKAPVVAISKLDITCVANLLVIFHDDTGLRENIFRPMLSGLYFFTQLKLHLRGEVFDAFCKNRFSLK